MERFNEYASFTLTTAIYRETCKTPEARIIYCLLGLVGETGEVAEKFKKLLRGGGKMVDLYRDPAIAAELGDVFWYLCRLSSELGFNISEEVIAANVEKLRSRQERGKIHGEGDNR